MWKEVEVYSALISNHNEVTLKTLQYILFTCKTWNVNGVINAVAVFTVVSKQQRVNIYSMWHAPKNVCEKMNVGRALPVMLLTHSAKSVWLARLTVLV